MVLVAAEGFSKEKEQKQGSEYKKRVLESTEVDFLSSYYSQDGDNAAVSGGIGTEDLDEFAPTLVVSMPLNDDDVLTIDVGISAYTSASSSNIDPFDGKKAADPFQASSGASKSDAWSNISGSYNHSSGDRNRIWSAKLSLSNEFDYNSFGFGGSYTRLFNEKNTELSVNANVYLDKWKTFYPVELRPFEAGGYGLNDRFFSDHTITGNTDYQPQFSGFNDKSRNSYSLGFNFSQILSKKLQASFSLDIVRQNGLLSTPYQRVYFANVANSYIENFQLADDVERLPDSRFKAAIGGRLNYYINEIFVVRTYYRYYTDDWGIRSHTASIEVPIKISDKLTMYPSYRFYSQTAADHFAPYEQHLSIEKYYTSDYDLSKFTANQFGFGVSYTDIFTRFHFWKLNMKSIDLRFYKYDRNSSFSASMVSFGIKFSL